MFERDFYEVIGKRNFLMLLVEDYKFLDILGIGIYKRSDGYYEMLLLLCYEDVKLLNNRL